MLTKRVKNEESKLRGVNLAVSPLKLKPGMFISLENWIPGKLHKIKKKRGVVQLSSSVPTLRFPHACGFEGVPPSLSFECDHDCPVGQFAEAEVEVEFTEESAPAGPAIRIDSGSTSDAFFGLAAIYDPATFILSLVFFDGEAVDETATLWDSIDLTSSPLEAGDVLRLEADDTTLYKYNVLVNSVEVITYTDTGHDLDITNSCVGFVVTGLVV
jgi:hypothetical protein